MSSHLILCNLPHGSMESGWALKWFNFYSKIIKSSDNKRRVNKCTTYNWLIVIESTQFSRSKSNYVKVFESSMRCQRTNERACVCVRHLDKNRARMIRHFELKIINHSSRNWRAEKKVLDRWLSWNVDLLSLHTVGQYNDFSLAAYLFWYKIEISPEIQWELLALIECALSLYWKWPIQRLILSQVLEQRSKHSKSEQFDINREP